MLTAALQIPILGLSTSAQRWHSAGPPSQTSARHCAGAGISDPGRDIHSFLGGYPEDKGPPSPPQEVYQDLTGRVASAGIHLDQATARTM